MGMKPYVVRQGDYLSQLAHRQGFDADEVWSASENEALRRTRPNREMLAPGDVLHVPDAVARGLDIHQGTTNRYKARVPRVRVTLELADDGHALADEPYRMEGAGPPVTGQSDANGHVEIDVPVTAREVSLVLTARRLVIPVLVGHLDPIDTMNGVRQRLQHLGYHFLGTRPPTPEDDVSALRRFQRDSRLPLTGEADDATRRALSASHRS